MWLIAVNIKLGWNHKKGE